MSIALTIVTKKKNQTHQAICQGTGWSKDDDQDVLFWSRLHLEPVTSIFSKSITQLHFCVSSQSLKLNYLEIINTDVPGYF